MNSKVVMTIKEFLIATMLYYICLPQPTQHSVRLLIAALYFSGAVLTDFYGNKQAPLLVGLVINILALVLIIATLY